MTLSLNVAVTKNGAFVVVGEVDVKATVGAVISAVRANSVAAVLLLPAVSFALSSKYINGDITISGGSDIKAVSFGINCDKVTDSRIGEGDISIIKPGDIFTECCCDVK